MTSPDSSSSDGHHAVGIEGRSSNELALVRTDLAVQRTLMAADRTLMAWVRTSMSMGSFGFTLYKILQGFQQAGTQALPSSDSPRNVGLFLMGLGVVAMVLGIVEYRDTLKKLQLLEHLRVRRPSLVMAVVMAIGGAVLFFGVITRLL